MHLIRAFTIFLCCVFALPASARTIDDIRKSGVIVIATEGAYPPFNYFQGPKLTGFEVELGEALARKMNLRVEWRTVPFNMLLPGLHYERWDLVLASFAVTEQRARTVEFAYPHYCSGGVIVAKDPAIKSADSLRGKTIAVQAGSTYMESVRSLPGVKEVKVFSRDMEARAALASDRADAWVSDLFTVKAAIDAHPEAGLKMGRYLFVERIAAAAKKGNTELILAYNQALADLMANGAYKEISERYFNADIHCIGAN